MHAYIELLSGSNNSRRLIITSSEILEIHVYKHLADLCHRGMIYTKPCIC